MGNILKRWGKEGGVGRVFGNETRCGLGPQARRVDLSGSTPRLKITLPFWLISAHTQFLWSSNNKQSRSWTIVETLKLKVYRSYSAGGRYCTIVCKTLILPTTAVLQISLVLRGCSKFEEGHTKWKCEIIFQLQPSRPPWSNIFCIESPIPS